MSKRKARSEWAFQLDQKLAMMQKLGWACVAALAVAGLLLIYLLAPANVAVYLTIGLAILLMSLYSWFSNAPLRAINEWTRRLAAGSTREMEVGFLDFLVELDQKLPSLRKKEMAFTIMYLKAVLLYGLGQGQEALRLLRSFNQIWDPSQKQRIDQLISRIAGEGGDAAPSQS